MTRPAHMRLGHLDLRRGADSFAEAASRAALGLGGAPADLAVVFAGGPNLEHADDGVAAVPTGCIPARSIGLRAQGVVGEAREIELGGVAVWAASLGSGRGRAVPARGAPGGGALARDRGVPDLDRADALLLLADPFSFPVEPLLASSRRDPGLPVIGGLASARDGRRLAARRTTARSAPGRGRPRPPRRARAACVSQGARPSVPRW